MSKYAAWSESNKADRRTLESLWRAWRKYLAAKEQPEQAAAVLQELDDADEAVFERVWLSVWHQARVQQPKLTEAEISALVLQTLLRDTVEDMSVPVIGADGEIERYVLDRLPEDAEDEPTRFFAWRELDPKRWTKQTRILATGLLLALVAVIMLWPTGSDVPALAATVPTPTPDAAATADADDACDAYNYVAPRIPGQREPLVFLSVAVGGRMYPIDTTVVCENEWQIATNGHASWLAGTFTNAAIHVPSLAGVQEGDPVVLRDSNAHARTLKVQRVETTSEFAIEVLDASELGLTLVAGSGAERTVIWATYP